MCLPLAASNVFVLVELRFIGFRPATARIEHNEHGSSSEQRTSCRTPTRAHGSSWFIYFFFFNRQASALVLDASLRFNGVFILVVINSHPITNRAKNLGQFGTSTKQFNSVELDLLRYYVYNELFCIF